MLPLSGEKHGERDTGLRASICDQPLHDRQGICGATLSLVERRQIVQRGHEVGMAWAERLSADRRRPLIERLGIAIAALLFIEVGEIVQRPRDVGMVAAEHLLADRKRPLDRRLGFAGNFMTCSPQSCFGEQAAAMVWPAPLPPV